MGNILFRTSDAPGDGYNPIVDNLIAASDNVGSYPCNIADILTQPVVCYNAQHYPLRTRDDLDEDNYNSESYYINDVATNLLDIENENLNDSTFDHIFPVHIRSNATKDFKSVVYYVNNTNSDWMSFYTLITHTLHGYLNVFDENTQLFEIDKAINSTRNDSIILTTENYLLEIVQFYMSKTTPAFSTEYYYNFFYNKPLRVLALCNMFNIDNVVNNYASMLIKSATASKAVSKRSSKDWIFEIDFNKLFSNEYIDSVSYYSDVCDALDIKPNFNYFEYVYPYINEMKFSKLIDNKHIVMLKMLEQYCED